jgi:phosphopantetheinyl transferase
MNEEECHQIFSSSRPDVTFIRMWTQKEAVLKLNGTGITDHLQQVLLPQNLEGIHLSTTDYLEQGFVLTSAISYHKNKESL